MDAKLPACGVVGDQVVVPITVLNGGLDVLKLDSLTVRPEGALAASASPVAVGEPAATESAVAAGEEGGAIELGVMSVGSGERMRRLVTLDVVEVPGSNGSSTSSGVLKVSASCSCPTKKADVPEGPGAQVQDAVVRTLSSSPRGFPVSLSVGGMLPTGTEGQQEGGQGGLIGAAAAAEWDWEVPVGASGLQATVKLMLSPVASLTAALQALLSEPCGCFEQTSATTYPTVMALHYMRAHADTPAESIAKAEGLLAKGWQLLASYEVQETGGFEWFGQVCVCVCVTREQGSAPR